MKNLFHIISKPDNVAIVVMIILISFFVWLAFHLARMNDKKSPTLKEEENKIGKEKIHTWPYLARKEFLVALIVLIILFVWSILIMAPLEEHATPNLTPNPAKAPWYFLGLQELLVYFDPWIAGVMLPVLIILGLMLIPYLDVRIKGNGYYTFKERKFEILIYGFGFLVLWLPLIIIGVFMRGPGWLWFWPWQEWDKSKVVADFNMDFSQVFGVDSRSTLGFIIGGVAVFLYFFAGMMVFYRLLKKKKPEYLKRLGLMRYFTGSFLVCTMIGVFLKIIFNLVFNINYIWVTPWFNI